MENNIAQQKKLILIKENCLKEIDEANENGKAVIKNLGEKMAYFLDKAKRLVRQIFVSTFVVWNLKTYIVVHNNMYFYLFIKIICVNIS